MDNNILHEWPLRKIQKQRFVCIEKRLTKHDFEKFQQATEQAKKNRGYLEMLKSGKNFKTNRKIKVYGPTFVKLWKELRVPFLIIQRVEKKLGNKTQEQYLEESVQINKEWEQKKIAELEAIDQYNMEVEAYNAEVNVVIDKIRKLKKWDEFIEFKGVKYGLPPRVGHLTPDCDGQVFTKTILCTCHRCEDWGGCGSSNATESLCSKCGRL